MHSVTLETEKCKGCINCIKRCPTEAIRVRNGKAAIMSDHCIDCGECIRACPNYAKKAISDNLSIMDEFKYKIALPAPTLFGQFKSIRDVNIILTALVNSGFDDVYEVSLAAQSIADYTRNLLPELERNLKGPIISSACPVIVKLICFRYPTLLENVLKIAAPVELAAIAAKDKAAKRTGLRPDEIGVFLISPCPAKITSSKQRIGFDNVVIDGVFSMTEIYKKLIPLIDKVKEVSVLSKSGTRGLLWACSGGEGKAIGESLFVTADGIDNVIRVLDEIENEKLDSIRFVELNACPGGCVGGCLTVENPFVARARIQRIAQLMGDERNQSSVDHKFLSEETVMWKTEPKSGIALRLDSDRAVAMQKLAQIRKIREALPGIDCGSCGAPSCDAHAEDIVMGKSAEIDCVFKLREKMGELLGAMTQLQEYLPPPLNPCVNSKGGADCDGQ